MRHHDQSRLCEWAALVDADLPDEIACQDAVDTGDERITAEEWTDTDW